MDGCAAWSGRVCGCTHTIVQRYVPRPFASFSMIRCQYLRIQPHLHRFRPASTTTFTTLIPLPLLPPFHLLSFESVSSSPPPKQLSSPSNLQPLRRLPSTRLLDVKDSEGLFKALPGPRPVSLWIQASPRLPQERANLLDTFLLFLFWSSPGSPGPSRQRSFPPVWSVRHRICSMSRNTDIPPLRRHQHTITSSAR